MISGKRVTSVHSREQRCLREDHNLPEWINRCLSREEPLVLRSINSKSFLTETVLFPVQSPLPISMTGLIDSGCSARAFADRNTIAEHNIKTTPLPRARALLLADGKPADTIKDYFIAPVAMGSHTELYLFFVTTLSKKTPLIFRLPWLQRHNPSIDWTQMTMVFNSPYCQAHCNHPEPGHRFPRAPVVHDPPSDYHDLPIAGEPRTIRKSSYRSPSVEDVEDNELNLDAAGALPLKIHDELIAGRNVYRMYAPYVPGGPEHRGQMLLLAE
jgi:hypothetical protein